MIPRQTVDTITGTPRTCNAVQCNIHAVNATFVTLIVCRFSDRQTSPYPKVSVHVSVCSPDGQVFMLLCPPQVYEEHSSKKKFCPCLNIECVFKEPLNGLRTRWMSRVLNSYTCRKTSASDQRGSMTSQLQY